MSYLLKKECKHSDSSTVNKADGTTTGLYLTDTNHLDTDVLTAVSDCNSLEDTFAAVVDYVKGGETVVDVPTEYGRYKAT